MQNIVNSCRIKKKLEQTALGKKHRQQAEKKTETGSTQEAGAASRKSGRALGKQLASSLFCSSQVCKKKSDQA
jgi:hypothetical protein